MNLKFNLKIVKLIFLLIIIYILSLTIYNFQLTAYTWRQDTDTDFNTGVFSNVVTEGTGTSAYIKIMQGWINMSPTTKPSARGAHSMCYDSFNKKVILFGGYDGSNDDDETWVYDYEQNKWTNMDPSTKPSARSTFSMCYDSFNKKVILFGGFDGGDETWAYDYVQNKWTNMNPSTKPSARYYHSICYDSFNKKVILYGDSIGNDETWAYDYEQNKWTNMNPATNPSAIIGSFICYDSLNKKVILFGGMHLITMHDETWAYDYEQNKWTNINPSTKPSARWVHSTCYDSLNKKVILFGGWDAGGYDDETWAYDYEQNKWTEMTPSTKPSARRFCSMCYDSFNNKVILFGGDDGSYDDETWAFSINKTGIYESKWFDTEGSFIFEKISWANISFPSGADQRFQIATASSSNGPWNFKGNDGSSSTFYTKSGETIWSGHTGDRYIKYKVYLETDESFQSPELDWVCIEYKGLYSRITELVPSEGKYFVHCGKIKGEAYSKGEGEHALAYVEIRIKSIKDDKYWDGGKWAASTNTWVKVKGKENWEYDCKNIMWEYGEEYYAESRAVDCKGERGDISEEVEFIVVWQLSKYSFCNYPNPFDPNKERTCIEYLLLKNEDVKLLIYDISGSIVKEWKFNKGSEGGQEGINRIYWDGRNSKRYIIANGVYISYLITSGGEKMNKIMVIK